MSTKDQNPVLLVERQSDGVVVVRLNRPSVRNALNLELRRALAATFTDLASDDAVRCVVITGDEKAFCAGADLSEYVHATPIEVMERDQLRLWRAIADFPKPLIAAINGYAIGGGCELAMHADILIAGESARFSQPEIRIGIIPGGGATQRLIRAVGKTNAMKFLLTGKSFTAEEAKAMLLVSDVVKDQCVLDEAVAMAKAIASMPPVGAKQIKALVIESMNAPLDVGLREEMKAFQLMFDTAEKTERMEAFLGKAKS
ncbi:enoyl-CoA hydratase-related protein [uncultured Cohaesibacter sp.]|uniref:enoyl-CoA hydratase-related protein n=1 Tax=uncultured Cohaesibacter sp. TaxID=1002546 RepID=UPI0029C6C08B|nr:enoyl-CoA hydratase-related protein [uncultured Cohaesibacter sp.]